MRMQVLEVAWGACCSQGRVEHALLQRIKEKNDSQHESVLPEVPIRVANQYTKNIME